MGENSVDDRLDRMEDSIEEIKESIKEISLVLTGSPMGITGISKRVCKLEEDVQNLKRLQWSITLLASILSPLALILIQKYFNV